MTVLTQSSSTNAGADLWVIPELQNSRASQKLDWYLNFQLSRSLHQSSLQLHADLIGLLKQCGLPETHYQDQSPRNPMSKMLIDSSQLLPNRWVVQLDHSDDLKNWSLEISEIWKGLRKPSLRVFLPTGLSSGDFLKAWKLSQTFDDFSVVVD